jgi:hypothetical protein
MTTNLRTLMKENRYLQMKRQVLAALSVKRVAFTILCCATLMSIAAPAWADQCAGANVNGGSCTVLITITGNTGNLTATISGSWNPYDNQDDQLVGIQNNSSVAVGALVLTGTTAQDPFGFDGDGPCADPNPGAWCPSPYPNGPNDPNPAGYEGPNNTFVGMSPDTTTGKVLFTVALPPNGGSTWFALEGVPTIVTAVGENKPLTAGATTTFPFGPFACNGENPITCIETSSSDDLQIKPVNSAVGDTLTVAPVPVPAGPLGLVNWGTDFFGIEGPLSPEPPSGQSRFSATNYPTLACVPYSDFSSSGNPGCVELELDCPPAQADACGFVYTAKADFLIDENSLPGGIGGAHFLGQHDNPPTYNGQCPTTGFNVDIFSSYTATAPDPILGGGKGNSCFVTAFDPTVQPVPPGTTISAFTGFEFPVSDTKINYILVGAPVPLFWQYDNSSGQPVTNLRLCKSINPDGTCATKGVSPPWVYLSLTALSATPACQAVAVASSPLPSIFNLGLLNFGKGLYNFDWNTLTNPQGLKGCQVSVVLQFDNGLFEAPAVFQYLN